MRWDVACEFPRLASRVLGAEHRYAYLAAATPGAGLFDRVTKLDLESGAASSYELGTAHYPSEPVFVAKEGGTREDDGYLLVLVYSAAEHTSHLAVLDASNPAAPTLARAHFDHHLPFTFHGNFVRA